jgi:deleted-in-malignant-brain-tumors protein 1
MNLSLAPHTSGSVAVRVAAYGQGSGPITLDNVACVGTETRLIDCPANALGVHNCAHREDSGVICTPLVIPGPGKHVPLP